MTNNQAHARATMLAELAGEQLQNVSVEDFMTGRLKRFSSEPEEVDQHSAGLEV